MVPDCWLFAGYAKDARDIRRCSAYHISNTWWMPSAKRKQHHRIRPWCLCNWVYSNTGLSLVHNMRRSHWYLAFDHFGWFSYFTQWHFDGFMVKLIVIVASKLCVIYVREDMTLLYSLWPLNLLTHSLTHSLWQWGLLWWAPSAILTILAEFFTQ